MSKRDDFPKPLIRKLAERAGQRCSNPDCGMPTSGPHSMASQSIIVGEAAHIYAAAPGGKRYDPDMTPMQRSSIENGIWLCSKCAKLIDSDEKKYTPKLLKKWKTEHEDCLSKQIAGSVSIKKEFVEAVPPLSTQELQLEKAKIRDNIDLRTEAKTDLKQHKITAADLVRAGFRPDRVHNILRIQDEATEKHNYRFSKLLNIYTDKKWDSVPRMWRALIAGLPIISQDINSESLNSLAEVAGELHPYLSKELRMTYHERLRPIMIGIIAELQAFIDDAAIAGGLHLSIFARPPTTWKDWPPWGSWGLGRSYRIEDSLLQGNWAYAFPHEVTKYKIDISKTWTGFLFDIISRLPDPDRQRGQLLKKYDFMALIYIWCATAPQDFRPALTDIVRHPVNSSDHTLAGVYKRQKEDFGKSRD